MTGRDAAQVIEAAAHHILEYEESFLAAVEKGGASAHSGDLMEHDEAVERIEQILGS